ncbi:MAG: LysM peptidoglycan-binding domain-containing protein [Planctomycetia bacterium]
MNTDRKIGFAMGILLIGLVAALFFRNEPLLNEEPIAVTRERELNQRLRERNVSVYLDDHESAGGSAEDVSASDEPQWTLRDVLKDMNDRNRRAPAPVTASQQDELAESSGQQEELDGFRTSRTRRENSDQNVFGKPDGLVPAPAGDTVITAKPAIPEPGSASRPLPPLFPPAEGTNAGHAPADTGTAATDMPGPEEFDEYVVKFGDTLSGIAEKTLGARGKYLLIYEANRDRMTSPDRLSPGKTLRIPRVAGTAPGLN